MSGALIICGLPIGNPDDISKRLIETLQAVDFIAAEDTRTASLFLSKFLIKKRLIAYHDFSDQKSREKVIDILKQGNKVALISDAGMPLISDPGYHLIQAAVKENINIQVVPGPTALTTALAISGLPSDRFCFEGFLARKPAQRQEQLRNLIIEDRTMIFYEAPHRLKETLQDIMEILGDRDCFVVRELTKKYEEQFRGKIGEIIEQFTQKEPKGEFVVVLAGSKKIASQPEESREFGLLRDLLLAKNISKKDVAEILSKTYDLNKNQLKNNLFS